MITNCLGRPNRARVANSNQHPRTFNRENQENRTNRSPRTYNNFEHKEEDLNDGKADFRYLSFVYRIMFT